MNSEQDFWNIVNYESNSGSPKQQFAPSLGVINPSVELNSAQIQYLNEESDRLSEMLDHAALLSDSGAPDDIVEAARQRYINQAKVIADYIQYLNAGLTT